MTLGCCNQHELVVRHIDFSAVPGYLCVDDADKLWTSMPDQLPIFEVLLNKRGRRWIWCVCTTSSEVVMQGSEFSRAAAQYVACRSFFLLLRSAPYRLMRLSNQKGAAYRRPGGSRSQEDLGRGGSTNI
jgi:hypothetical protein